MKPSPLRLRAPASSLEEALAALAEGGEDAKPLAGGQSLVPRSTCASSAPDRRSSTSTAPGSTASRGRRRRSASARLVRQARSSAIPRSSAAAAGRGAAVRRPLRRPATAARSAARSRTPTAPPSCRSACSRSAARSSSRARGAGARSPPTTSSSRHLTTLEPGELVVETRLAAATSPARGAALRGARAAPRRLRARARGLRARRRRTASCARASLAVGRGDRPAATLPDAAAALVDGALDGERLAAAVERGRRGRRAATGCTRRPAYLRHLIGVLTERAARQAWAERRGWPREDRPDGQRPAGAASDVEPRLLLSDFLRHDLGLTGTHVGCEHGVCGACTVRLDGVAVRACLLLAVQADGCRGRDGRGARGGRRR